MNWKTALCVIAPPLLVVLGAVADAADDREVYLDLASRAFAANLEVVPAQVEDWTESYEPSPVWGYGPPGGPVWLAALGASLYELTGDESYAGEAARWLAEMPRFKEFYPAEVLARRADYSAGLPTLTDFFQLGAYCQAYLRIGKSPSLAPEQRVVIEQAIVESADYALVNPEWGAMNRAMLRAEGLELAAQALPDHPESETWRKLAWILANDSRGQWEIEDTSIYHPVWLLSMIHFADLTGDRGLFDRVTTRYYLDYFVRLMSPAGMVPEFGDARFDESWPSYLACLERGAAETGRADQKWAAARILDVMIERYGTGLDSRSALILLDAYRWSDESIEAVLPVGGGSEEVLEDLVGKKVVFRTGFEDDDTYLMLNYRDEGVFARLPRDFLRRTIPVEEEKMHHGHADENAICLLMSGGSVLLNHPGYRDAIPSGAYGAWRADYFHNRLVGRPGKRGRQQPLFDFLRDSGAYHPVVTEKIDFLNLEHVDMSRTRLIDDRRGFESDRVIVFLKEMNAFLVFDVVEIRETGYHTFTTLWHGTALLGETSGAYVTAVESLTASGGAKYRPPQDEALLIHFLQQDRKSDGSYPVRRAMQDEVAVYQTVSTHYHAGQIETFVTLLAPHPRGEPFVGRVSLVDVEPERAGIGVEIVARGTTHYVCVKTDLDRDVLTENVRPRYTFESGRVKYGPFETDASFLHARREGNDLSWSAANMVKVVHDGQSLFEARRNTLSCEPDDLGTGHGPIKWRYWEDTATVDR